MPTYEYKCTQEGSKFELWQEVGSEAPPCPTCGAPSKKVFGPPRVHFKGSGFYLTDMRAEKGIGKEDGAPEAKTEAKTEAKSDGKTATSDAKTESKSDTAPAAAPSSSTPAPAVAAPTK